MKQKTLINSFLSLSSLAAFLLIVATLIITFFSPPFFTQEPANLAFLFSFLGGALMAILLFVTTIRRKKILLNITPLSPTLIYLTLTVLLAVFIKHSHSPTLSFLGLAGLLINFSLLSLLSSALIKKNNALIVVKIILAFALLSTLILLAQSLGITSNLKIGQFFNQDPLMLIGVIVLGLATVFFRYFKKNRLSSRALILVPIFILGLAAGIFNFYQQKNFQSLDLSTSIEVLNKSLTFSDSSTLPFSQILFGQKHRTYTDLFFNLSPKSFSSNFSGAIQSFNLALTVLPLLGLVVFVSWLALVLKTVFLALDKKNKERNYLFFILLASFAIQLFTPIYPFFLILQAFIIAFTTDKNKETVINLNVATTFTKKDGQKEISKKEKGSFVLALFFLIILLPFGFSLVRIGKSYLGYFYAQKALTYDYDLQSFDRYAQKAQRMAPFIDYFNRLMAISSLEKLVTTIQQDPQKTNLEVERDLAQQAIEFSQKAADISPLHAPNLITKGAIYQEISQYNSNKEQTNNQAVSSYASAILTQPYNPNLYLQLASLYQLNEELDLALSLCQEALKVQNDYLPAVYQLAQLYQLKGEKLLAEKTYIQVQQLLDQKSPDYQTNFQLIQYHLDQLRADD